MTRFSTTGNEDQDGSSVVDNSNVMAVAISAIILIAAAATGVLALGGNVDLQVSMQGDNMVLVNESKGIFQEYRWNVNDEAGEPMFEKWTSGKDTVIWPVGNGTGFTVMLTGFTLIGTERSAEHKFGSYEVTWERYSVDVGVSMDDYLEYRNHVFETGTIMPRWPGGSVDEELLTEYMSTETESHSFERIVTQLKAQAPEGSVEVQANYLMGFVQNLDGDSTYKADISPRAVGGAHDYWNFPMETLFNKGGDCEDLAILLMALYEEFFDNGTYMAMAIYWGDGTVKGHAIASLNLAEPPSPKALHGVIQTITPEFQQNGRTYYTCEVISQGWEIGSIQKAYGGMEPNRFIVIAV